MRTTTTAVDPHTLQARITLDRNELEGYLRATKEGLAREVTVEGFRKGRAPQHLADAKLGQEAVRAEALERALGESFTRAAQEQGWDIARTAELKIERNDQDGLEYSIRVHLWPVVVLPDLAEVKVARREVAVADAEIDEALDTVRTMRATFLDKTGPAASGDRVEVDFDASLDGTPVPGGSSRNHPLVVGGKSFMPGFEEALVGLAPGMAKEFSLTAPADYYEKNLAGKKIDFTVTIQKVQAVLKPNIDDAFAKSLGAFADVSRLRDSVRQGLAREKEVREHQRLRLAILDAIIERAGSAGVPAPEDMVASELEGMVHRFSHDLKGRDIELSMYLARLGKTEEQLKTDWRPEAQRQVRIMLILRQVAKDKGVGIEAGALDAAVNETVAQIIKGGQVSEAQIDLERVRSTLAEQMLRDKVLELLESACAA